MAKLSLPSLSLSPNQRCNCTRKQTSYAPSLSILYYVFCLHTGEKRLLPDPDLGHAIHTSAGSQLEDKHSRQSQEPTLNGHKNSLLLLFAIICLTWVLHFLTATGFKEAGFEGLLAVEFIGLMPQLCEGKTPLQS